LQQQRQQLFQPIQDKAVKAISDVAAENGFTYILDSGVGVVVYSAPNAENILPLVKKKLGLL
jgi:outer membrane protein